MTRLSPNGLIRNKIQEARAESGLTQQELADALAVTRATVVALERGDYNPSLDLAFRAARHFHCKVDDLFTYAPHRGQRGEKK